MTTVADLAERFVLQNAYIVWRNPNTGMTEVTWKMRSGYERTYRISYQAEWIYLADNMVKYGA